jgi:hypothetical protein
VESRRQNGHIGEQRKPERVAGTICKDSVKRLYIRQGFKYSEDGKGDFWTFLSSRIGSADSQIIGEETWNDLL